MSEARKPMVVAAARVICRRGADECSVDPEDSWKIYGESYIEDAQAALEACGALDLLALAEAYLEWIKPLIKDPGMQKMEAMARAAIAKSEGSQHG